MMVRGVAFAENARCEANARTKNAIIAIVNLKYHSHVRCLQHSIHSDNAYFNAE
ncbi:MAG: hypothetical protein ACI86M_002545 [Saprospiraceae bacterium]|jgi:hypothetical protein